MVENTALSFRQNFVSVRPKAAVKKPFRLSFLASQKWRTSSAVAYSPQRSMSAGRAFGPSLKSPGGRQSGSAPSSRPA